MNTILSFIIWATPTLTAGDFSAKKLVISGQTARLEGEVAVRLGAISIRSDYATLQTPRDCIATMLSPKTRSTSHREDRKCNLRQRLELRTALVSNPSGRLRAKTIYANITSEQPTLRFTLLDGELTPCSCLQAPWSIHFTKAELNIEEGGWAQWPVLRFYGVPIAAAPIWYIPLGGQRSGLLPPNIAWRTEGGFQVIQPIYLALNSTMDAEIGPGLQGVRTPIGYGRYRWHVNSSAVGEVQARALGADLRLEGHGQLGRAGLDLRLDGEFMNAPDRRHAFVRSWEDGRQKHTHGLFQMRAGGSQSVLGLDGLIVQETDWSSALEESRHQAPLTLWALSVHQFGRNTLTLGLTNRQIWSARHGHLYRLQVSPSWTGQTWLSALKISGQAHGHAIGFLGEEGVQIANDHRIEGTSSLNAEVAAIGRGFGLVHRTSFFVKGQLTEFIENGKSIEPDVWAQGVKERAITVGWGNRIHSGPSVFRIDASQSFDFAVEETPRLPTRLDWQWQAAWLHLMGRHQWAGLHSGNLGIGQSDDARFRVGTVYLDKPPMAHSLFRRITSEGGFRQQYQRLEAWSVTAQFQLKFGSAALGGTGAVNPRDGQLVGLGGRFGLNGQCNCWSISLRAEHESVPKSNRFFLSLRLSPLDPEPFKAH